MAVKNILFIMVDQLRADCVGGLPGSKLATPHLEAMAARGTRFTNAWCQSPICGPSRMSFYTGLYPATHGATFNQAPLDAGVMTMGDYLRPLGLRVALAGKTHVRADRDGMARLGLEAREDHGVTVAEGGFEPWLRHDGLYPDNGDGIGNPDLAYNQYLRAQGYEAGNPWHDIANAGLSEDGETLSGWYLRNAAVPARVDPAHSETAWTTDKALDFIAEMDDAPWCLHLSYIKPHWPYIAPAPYHAAFGPEDVWEANREAQERHAGHPVHLAFMEHDESRQFSREATRRLVIPTYLGLVRELDDNIGRLMARLDAMGRLKDTLIVLTSDHGDLLGDHWLGEKELAFRESAQIPLIVYHPDKKGAFLRDDPVEAIDLVPTFIDALGAPVPGHRLEGRSLLPLLGTDAAATGWREALVGELDYAPRQARRSLGLGPDRGRLWSVRTDHWLYVHHLDLPPELYDLRVDPSECHDIGRDADFEPIRREMKDRLFEHLINRPVQRTATPDYVEAQTDDWDAGGRIKVGIW